MTYVLLIAIVILLIVLLNKTKSYYYTLNENNKRLNENLKILNGKLNQFIDNGEPVNNEKNQTTAKPSFDTTKEASITPKVSTPEQIDSNTIEANSEARSKGVLESKKPEALPVYHIQKEATIQSAIEREEVSKIPKKSFWEQFKEKNPDLEKFIGENLINKLGILILVLGISYFVKYAIDKDWINEPARVGIGVLCGALVMLIANKLRKKYAAFSSVLVAGAISIFYFTIAIAFHEYKLFSQEVAFAIMVVITIFSGLISLSYNRIELAILSLIGGFAVPFMISTGSGNYIVLFTYIIILNIGIIGLAFYKKWQLVNTLAFIFTVFLFGGWFIKETGTATPHYLGSLIFAFVFYLIFVVTNIINNVRTKAFFNKSQLSILGASTFLFFGVGMVVLSNYHIEFRGLFTAGLAILNLFFAWFLYKKFNLDKVAVYMLIGLTLTFITLAIPIQFQGNYITLFWAAEAVLLMWLAKKSGIGNYRFASVIVHGLALISLVLDWVQKYNDEAIITIVFNPIFGTGVFVVASVAVVYLLLKKEETANTVLWTFVLNTTKYRKFIVILGITLLYVVGFLETLFQAVYHIDNWSSALAFPVVYHLIFTAILAFMLNRRKIIFNNQVVTLIACINIILFAFVFLRLVFEEHNDFVANRTPSQIAFYLHYVMLVITFFFGFLLYQSNKKKVVFSQFNSKAFIWVLAFVVVFIASGEVLIHGLKLLSKPIELDSEGSIFAYEAVELAKEKIIKTSFPVLWGVLAFLFLILGIKKQVKSLRIIALVLLGLTIVKLFIYDINNISETGKIIAFILLGILILVISFVYQKIKVLVIDDDKEEVNNDLKKN